MISLGKFTCIQLPLLVALPLSLALIPLFLGCQQETPEGKRPAVTIENLQTAYGKSVMRHNLYSRFVRRAEEERYSNVARLFRAVARSEEIHAALHAALLRKLNVEPAMPEKDSAVIGSTLQTVKMESAAKRSRLARCIQASYERLNLNIFPKPSNNSRKSARPMRDTPSCSRICMIAAAKWQKCLTWFAHSAAMC